MRALLVLLMLMTGTACAAGRICISRDVLLFGEQAVGTSVTQSSTVSNCGDAPFSFTDVSVHPATGPAYRAATTCATGQTLGPGAACSIDVTFAPAAPGQVSGGLWLHNTTATPDQIVTFYGRGQDARAGTATLVFEPGSLAFGRQVVGTTSNAQTLTLRNLGPADVTMTALVLNGPTPYDFRFPGTCMLGVAYPAGASCELYFYFTPAATDTRLARLNVDAPQLASLAMTTISGLGIAAAPPPPAVDVVEFFNATLAHYFLTAVAEEAEAIDAGKIGPGWVRTGFGFRAYTADTMADGTLPVCRFFGTPGQGPDAHFFTADAAECALVRANPRWLYEGVAFRAVPANGACAAGTAPVVRFFRPGAIVTDARHRYVKDPAEIARMRSAGWIEEGAVFCSNA